jgi:NADPH-dependent 2,4-dienoyl-CoA reductase/sulfur reductase-like enzyme
VNRREDGWRGGRRFLTAVLRAVRAAAPGLGLGVRISGDSRLAEQIATDAAAEGVDYLSITLGDSSGYLGSVGIVPPPPLPENAIAGHAARFRLGPPLLGNSRVVDVEEADRLVAEGVLDAVGMTRALIADPDLPAKARAGEPGRIVRCVGCNICIAHYHAGTPIVCAVNPRTGRERRLPRPERAAARRRLVVVGAGPAGLAAATEARAAGHDVVVLERSDRIGGQLALAGAAPGSAVTAARLAANHADVEVELETEATPESVLALSPDAVVVATGARPFEPRLEVDGVDVIQAWDVLAGGGPAGRRVVVADWGGDPTGLDTAELLRAAGNEVTLALASVTAAESVHQYRRNLYLQRLYRAGVVLAQHQELVGASGGSVRFRNAFARELETSFPADVLVLALGRVPEDELAAALAAAGLRVVEAGDCCGPRSLEEAVLEGTLEVRRVFA